jgi:hypothetical protein
MLLPAAVHVGKVIGTGCMQETLPPPALLKHLLFREHLDQKQEEYENEPRCASMRPVLCSLVALLLTALRHLNMVKLSAQMGPGTIHNQALQCARSLTAIWQKYLVVPWLQLNSCPKECLK